MVRRRTTEIGIFYMYYSKLNLFDISSSLHGSFSFFHLASSKIISVHGTYIEAKDERENENDGKTDERPEAETWGSFRVLTALLEFF